MHSNASPHSPPSPWVLRWLAAVKPGGRVLDVACGRGRHIAAALEAGHTVTGIDRDVAGNALADDPRVTLIAVDLETDAGWPLTGQRFDGVIVTNYLHRPILPDIVRAVAADGVLIYETFAAGNERYGRPSRPAFLLQPGELLDAVRGTLIPLAFEHGRFSGPDRIIQRIAAAGSDHPWLPAPEKIQLVS